MITNNIDQSQLYMVQDNTQQNFQDRQSQFTQKLENSPRRDDVNTFFYRQEYQHIQPKKPSRRPSEEVSLDLIKSTDVKLIEDDNQNDLKNQIQKTSEKLINGTYKHVERKEKVLIWKKSFLEIIFLVSLWTQHIKKTLVYKYPHYLEKQQIDAIQDKTSFLQEEYFNQNPLKNKYQSYKYSVFVQKIIKKLLTIIKIIKQYSDPCEKFLHHFFHDYYQLIPTIQPYTNFSVCIDILTLVIVFFNLILIPFEVLFQKEQSNLLFQQISQFSIIFICLVNCNQAYYVNGILVRDRIKMSQNYIKNILITDFLSIYSLLQDQTSYYRLFFVFNVLVMYRTLDKLQESLDAKKNNLIPILTTITELLYVCHFMSCIWYHIGYIKQQIQQDNWLSAKSLVEEDTITQYINSVYYSIITITTIGYGDISPTNNTEKVYVIFFSILSSGMFAYIMGIVHEFIKDRKKKNQDYEEKLKEILDYLSERHVDFDLRNQSREYFYYLYHVGLEQKKLTYECIQKYLPQSLRDKIKKEIFYKELKKNPILGKHFSDKFLQKLSLKMNEYQYGPDEIIQKQDDYESISLYMIRKGSVQAFIEDKFLNNNNNQDDIKQEDNFIIKDFFGQQEFFGIQADNILNYKSKDVSQIYQLKLSYFLNTLQEFQEDKETYYLLRHKFQHGQEYSRFKLNCLNCKSIGHLLQKCPLIYYQPVTQKIIMNFNNEFNKYVKTFKRNKDKLKYRTLLNQNNLEEKILDFCEQNDYSVEMDDEYLQENEEILDNLEEIAKDQKIQNNKRHFSFTQIFQDKEKNKKSEEKQECLFSHLQELQLHETSLDLKIQTNKQNDNHEHLEKSKDVMIPPFNINTRQSSKQKLEDSKNSQHPQFQNVIQIQHPFSNGQSPIQIKNLNQIISQQNLNQKKQIEIEFDISKIFKIFFPDQNLNHVLNRYNKSVKILERLKIDTIRTKVSIKKQSTQRISRQKSKYLQKYQKVNKQMFLSALQSNILASQQLDFVNNPDINLDIGQI